MLNAGPGEYDVLRASRSSGPAYTIPGRTKPPPHLSGESVDLPGPGAYQLPGQGLSGPAFTIAPKGKRRADNDVPGPGEYETTKVVHSGACVCITLCRLFGRVHECPCLPQQAVTTAYGMAVRCLC